jgi:hypothetical protein
MPSFVGGYFYPVTTSIPRIITFVKNLLQKLLQKYVSNLTKIVIKKFLNTLDSRLCVLYADTNSAKSAQNKEKAMTQLAPSITVAELAEMAHRAGMEAGNKAIPQPMVIVDGETKEVIDVVDDGLCGFAWINIKPARGAFVNYLKARNWGDTNTYAGGYEIWVSQFNQSVTRKEAYAKAFAKVLNEWGIKAYAGSRLD